MADDDYAGDAPADDATEPVALDGPAPGGVETGAGLPEPERLTLGFPRDRLMYWAGYAAVAGTAMLVAAWLLRRALPRPEAGPTFLGIPDVPPAPPAPTEADWQQAMDYFGPDWISEDQAEHLQLTVDQLEQAVEVASANRAKRLAPKPPPPTVADSSYGLVIPTPNGHTAPPGTAAWPSVGQPDPAAPLGTPAVAWPWPSAADDEQFVVQPVDPQALVIPEPVHGGPED